MEKLKLLLIGILMISLSGCASYYMKFDNTSVKTPNFYYGSNTGRRGGPVISVERSIKRTLCKKCFLSVIPDRIGKCIRCGNQTVSISYKICKECSENINVCQVCLNKLYSIAYTY